MCLSERMGEMGTYIARETEGEERERYWDLAISYYEGYEAYKQRASHRKIPVMVLEPIELISPFHKLASTCTASAPTESIASAFSLEPTPPAPITGRFDWTASRTVNKACGKSAGPLNLPVT